MNDRLKNIKLKPVRYYSQESKGIDLTMGEGHFNSPFNAKLKAYEALLKNNTKYSQIEGNVQLRKLLIEKYYPAYDFDQNIIITNGATQALFNVLLAIISSKEDEIIVLSPYYPAYLQSIILMGGTPIVIDSEKTHFKVTVECLKKVVTQNTKAIIINEPNNPTGITYTKEEKEMLLKYFEACHLFVIIDEIYNSYTDDTFISFSKLVNEELRKKIIFINGLSKSHMMTGYRIGYVISDDSFNNELKKINYLTVSSISTIMQQAAIGALEEEYYIEFIRKYYLNNVKILKDSLDGLNIDYVKTTCGFYIFMNVSQFNMSGLEFCCYFSKHYQVALVPGHLFGDSFLNYVRISCSNDIKDIIKFVNYFTDFIEKNDFNKK